MKIDFFIGTLVLAFLTYTIEAINIKKSEDDKYPTFVMS